MGHPWAATRSACRHGHPWPQHLAYNNRDHAYCAECNRIRARASRRRTYVPVPPTEPDPIAVERAVAGDPPDRLTASERAAAVLALTQRNVSARQIAERIGCSQRTVHRARSRYAAAA